MHGEDIARITKELQQWRQRLIMYCQRLETGYYRLVVRLRDHHLTQEVTQSVERPLGCPISPMSDAAISRLSARLEFLRPTTCGGELLLFAKGDAAEMEFLLPSHLIIFFPEGMSGGCEWRNSERSGKLSSMPPNTVLFNPAQAYLSIRKRRSQCSCRAFFLTIAPKVMDRLSASNVDTGSVRLVQQIGVDNENVRGTLLAILEEIESPGWDSKFYAETLVTLLVSQLIRCALNLTGPQRMPYKKGGLPNWRLKRALELLEGDLREAPSMAELARHLQLHPTSVCRAFKQSTGLPPHQYLLSRRIECAKEMMGDPARSLTEIALDCGFSDSSQFSVVFKRIVGLTPREYRRSL